MIKATTMTYYEHSYMEVVVVDEFGINLCIYCDDVYKEALIVNVITVNAKVDKKKVRTHSKYQNIGVRNCVPYNFYLYAR